MREGHKGQARGNLSSLLQLRNTGGGTERQGDVCLLRAHEHNQQQGQRGNGMGNGDPGQS